MNRIDDTHARIYLAARGKNHVVGWHMTPEIALQFFERQGKTVLTFFGYSVDYEDEPGMLKIAGDVLTQYSPHATLINMGATQGGVGVVYTLAKSMGFGTTAVVSTQTLPNPEWISEYVDTVCFIEDEGWGGVLDSGELSPTSKVMVLCSDVLVGIGGGPISRDEMLAGQAMGKPVRFYPAEIRHELAIQRAKSKGLPLPTSFWGQAHEVFAK